MITIWKYPKRPLLWNLPLPELEDDQGDKKRQLLKWKREINAEFLTSASRILVAMLGKSISGSL